MPSKYYLPKLVFGGIIWLEVNIMKIVVDAMGGDYAPSEVLKGCAEALNVRKDLQIVVTGPEEVLKSQLTEYGADMSRVEIIHAPDTIENTEHPVSAVRNKPNSSIVKAFDNLRTREDIDGFVSAGSTGATLTGATLKLGRIDGVSRPALAPFLPTKTGKNVLLIDCGANMDAKPINLVHYAQMGSEYMKAMGVENPRVALLNVGVEEGKGNELSKEVYPLLQNCGVNFIGNMEAREVVSGDADVVVCDAFAGNVLLKATEGAALFVVGEVKKAIKGGFWSKVGALFQKRAFRQIKEKLNYNKAGGAPFLGVKKVVIKTHGDSKAETVCNAIMQAVTLVERDVVAKIKDVISKYAQPEA